MRASLPMLLAVAVLPAAVSPCPAADDRFDSGGVKIRYAVVGKGDAVVLIHGWMADSSMWGKNRLGDSQVVATLAQEFQVITLDCRGHGGSDKPHDPKEYGPKMAEDVVRLLDHLEVDKAHLVGYSMGAMLAGHIVITHPDRVLSVTFAGGAPILKPDPIDQKRNDEFLAKLKTDQGLQALAKVLFGEQDGKALVAANRSLSQLRATEEGLRKYRGPVLFVYGEGDWESTVRHIRVARKALGRGEVIVIPNADHFTTPSRPEFRQAILQFLRAHKRERQAATNKSGQQTGAASGYLEGRCPASSPRC
jgi:pimeloyl-ACP methyl ester carboxylesterase